VQPFPLGQGVRKKPECGGDYKELPDVIAVNVVDFNFPPLPDYHTCFHLREDRVRDFVLTNSLEIHFINMVKYRKAFGLRRGKKFIPDGAPYWTTRWLAWLNASSSQELIAEVKKMDSAIVAAADKLEELLANEDAVRFYEMRFDALCNETSARNHAERVNRENYEKALKKGIKKGMKDGRAAGIAEGREEGREEGMFEIAQKMKALDRPLPEIAEITSLSPEVIGKL
jgi:predicted transposase/invertase (TIGR01784 family)